MKGEKNETSKAIKNLHKQFTGLLVVVSIYDVYEVSDDVGWDRNYSCERLIGHTSSRHYANFTQTIINIIYMTTAM